jgi:ADP-ribose pyrophosphatase YjhB (NUDIX family)
MEIIYAKEPFPTAVKRTLFLAGPTPRSAEVASWRPEALRLLAARGFDGTVFIPEDRGGGVRGDYLDQIDWELEGLQRADCVLFWVPRELETMPAFTTNVEYGLWARSGKVVLGAPPGAPKLRYLRALSTRAAIPQHEQLDATVDAALAFLGEGAARQGGECQVPLHIFQSDAFQRWNAALRQAGNVLEGARLEWSVRVSPEKDFLFYWALHVDVRVTAEGRHKRNEIVLARPDIATVVLYRKDPQDLRQTRVALVREFRSPVSNVDGYVHECPGGSSYKGERDMAKVALEEVHEEVGLVLAPERLRPLGHRQLMATMSSHHAHVFAAELTLAELEWLEAQAGVVHGESATERTTIELWTLEQLLARDVVDWSTLGMVASAILG